MLQPPGSSTGRRAQTQQTSRRKAAESPDDIVRRMQRFSPNKRCADCNSRLPSCVNLTLGTFVCITCAGIHRELNQRVKGVGHSSFTQEEAVMIKETNNEKVNAQYMARYNPRNERMKQPQDNSDPQLLKSWIRKKYVERAWYDASSNRSGKQNQQDPQPTVVQIPPKTTHTQDIFAAQPAPAPAGQPWDAFGKGTPNNVSNSPHGQSQAVPPNFAASHTKQLAQAPPPQDPSFQANFDQFPIQGQSSNQAQMSQPPKQQQGEFANFTSQQPQTQLQPQSQQQFNPNLNFPSIHQNTPQQQMHQPFPSQQVAGSNGPQQIQHAHPQPQQQNFASFPSPQHNSLSGLHQPTAYTQQPSPHNQVQPQSHQQSSSVVNIPQHQTQQPFVQQQQQSNFASFASNVVQTAGVATQFQQTNIGGNNLPLPNLVTDNGSVGPRALTLTSEPQNHPEITEPKSSTLESDKSHELQHQSGQVAGSKYSSGQAVYYKSESFSGPAKILKVHLDDDLDPFYTVLVNGKEKQTDDSHLCEKNPAISEIEELLSELSAEQLLSVKDFICQLKSNEPSAQPSISTTTGKTEKQKDSLAGIPSPGSTQQGGPVPVKPMTMPLTGTPSPSMFPVQHQQQAPPGVARTHVVVASQPQTTSQQQTPAPAHAVHQQQVPAGVHQQGKDSFAGIPSPGSTQHHQPSATVQPTTMPAPPLTGTPSSTLQVPVHHHQQQQAPPEVAPQTHVVASVSQIQQQQTLAHVAQQQAPGGNPFDMY